MPRTQFQGPGNESNAQWLICPFVFRRYARGEVRLIFGFDVRIFAELGGSLIATLGNYIPGAQCIRELFLSSLNGFTVKHGHVDK